MRWTIGLVYLAVVNLSAFLMFGYDKYKACRGRWRISEKMLLFLAWAGGSAGAWCGMYFFHHKTKKVKFKIGIPAIFVIQCVVCMIGINRII